MEYATIVVMFITGLACAYSTYRAQALRSELAEWVESAIRDEVRKQDDRIRKQVSTREERPRNGTEPEEERQMPMIGQPYDG